MPTKNEIEGVKYNYTVDAVIEEESKLLKEAISELKKELELLKLKSNLQQLLKLVDLF